MTVGYPIRQSVEGSFLSGGAIELLRRTRSLIETGSIDSTGGLDHFGCIENEFAFPVPDAERVAENLDTIATVADYVTGQPAPAANAKAA
jgi:acyl carrier protein